MLKGIFLILFVFTNMLAAETLVIFSAANLKFFFEDIKKVYLKSHPNDKIKIKFGSSGVLVQDILNGEKYDIFLAANMQYPQKIYEAKKAVFAPKLYTTGSIILLIANHKGLDKKGIYILNDEKIKEITIANKKTAPYGVAALEAIKNANLYEQLKSKIIYSTDASDVIGDVLWYGNAGLLPKSAINFLPRGYNIKGENWIEVDKNLYNPIKQGFVISKDGFDKNITKNFVEFLLGDCQEIFKNNGYE